MNFDILTEIGGFIVKHTIDKGGLGITGGILCLLSIISGFSSVHYAGKRHRHFLLAVVASLLLACCGYVCCDFWYVTLNLKMRDVSRVRADCQRLMEAASKAGDGGGEVTEAALPASLARFGAKEVLVDNERVLICLRPDGWGYLYLPAGHLLPYGARPTLYRDFYEYRYIESIE